MHSKFKELAFITLFIWVVNFCYTSTAWLKIKLRFIFKTCFNIFTTFKTSNLKFIFMNISFSYISILPPYSLFCPHLPFFLDFFNGKMPIISIFLCINLDYFNKNKKLSTTNLLHIRSSLTFSAKLFVTKQEDL